MPRRKSNVKIENGKVILSDEVLKIIESWRTEENSIWIDKYKLILLDTSNISAEKFRSHHIIPVFLFKDEIYSNRKKALSLANKMKENLIKLSIYNHLLAHYYLWKIFYTNNDAKMALTITFHNENIEDLTELQIQEISKRIEECAEKNKTEEDEKNWNKNWKKENQEHVKKYQKEYYENHKENLQKNKRIYDSLNKEKISEYNKKYSHRRCYDPIANDYCGISNLYARKHKNKEKYKDIKVPECVINSDDLNFFIS